MTHDLNTIRGIDALRLIDDLSYTDAAKLHRMTPAEKARSLAATIVAMATVARVALFNEENAK